MTLVHIFIEIMQEVFDRLMQNALVAFESQHILATLVDDLRRNLTLTTHGIDGNEATSPFQKLKQLRGAVISLDFSAVASWPRTSRLVSDQALTTCETLAIQS